MIVRAGGWQAEPNRPWTLPQEASSAPGGAPELAGEVWPQHRGRGTYELSDGRRVAGREDAFAAQAELDQEGDDGEGSDAGQGGDAGEGTKQSGPADQAGQAAPNG